MCRHLGWVGPATTLEQLVLAPAYGLLRQSYAPRRQRHGRFNADGFGVGWYAPRLRAEPARYRRAVPLWTDASFASFAGTVTAGCVLAAVRSATPGMPVEESATAPFAHGRFLLSHNGRADPVLLRALLDGSPVAESTCDSALLAALVWARLGAGSGLADAVAAVLAAVGRTAPSLRLNLLATDGVELAATVWGETLSASRRDGGVLLASEPTDDAPGWQDLPDRSLVRADAGGFSVTPLVLEAQ
jgi:gamma-glutamyl hercynylcysteine S-oxide hydrolase